MFHGAARFHAPAIARASSRGNAENGSHLVKVGTAEGLAGGIPPGVNENGQVGRWDFGNGRHARHFPPENATNDTWQYVL